jgi:hypothetical protein
VYDSLDSLSVVEKLFFIKFGVDDVVGAGFDGKFSVSVRITLLDRFGDAVDTCGSCFLLVDIDAVLNGL